MKEVSAGLPILTYHSFDSTGSITSTEPTRFVETMDRLVSAGFQCIDLVGWLVAGRPDSPRSFALTFDDGDSSILAIMDAFPRLGLTASVFLVTDHVGRDNDWPGQPHWVPRSRLLDWSQVADLSGRGLTFGSHTRTHPDLSLLDRPSLSNELRGSRETIEDRLGVACPLLAYPYGRDNERVRREAGLTYRTSFGTRLDLATSENDLADLPRIDAYYLRSDRLLDRLIDGQAGRWLRWRRRLRAARSAARRGRGA